MQRCIAVRFRLRCVFVSSLYLSLPTFAIYLHYHRNFLQILHPLPPLSRFRDVISIKITRYDRNMNNLAVIQLNYIFYKNLMTKMNSAPDKIMSAYPLSQQHSQRRIIKPPQAPNRLKHQCVRRRYNINRMFKKDESWLNTYKHSLKREFLDFNKFMSQLQKHPDMYYKVQYQFINQHVRKFKPILFNILSQQSKQTQQYLTSNITKPTRSLFYMPYRTQPNQRSRTSRNMNEPTCIKNISKIIVDKRKRSQCSKNELQTQSLNQKIKLLSCNPQQYIIMKELIKLASQDVKYKIYLPALAKVSLFGISQLDRNKSISQIKIRVQLKIAIPGFKSYPEYYKKMFTKKLKLKIKTQLLISPQQKLIHLDKYQLCGLKPELFHPTASGIEQHHYRYQVYDSLDKYLKQIYNWDEYKINHIKRQEFYQFDQSVRSENHPNKMQKGQFQGLIFVIDIINVTVLNQRKSFLSPFQIIDLNGIIDLCPIQTSLKQWQHVIFLAKDQFQALSLQVDPKFQINFNLISLYPLSKDITPTTAILYNHIYSTDRMQIGQFTLAQNYMFLETSNTRKGSYKLKKSFLTYYWQLKEKNYFKNIMKTNFGSLARDYVSHQPTGKKLVQLTTLLEQLTKATSIYLQKCKSLKAYFPIPPQKLSKLQIQIKAIQNEDEDEEIIIKELPSVYPLLLYYIEEIDQNLHGIDFQLQKSLQIQCDKQLIQGIQDMIVYIENRRMKLWQFHQFILNTIVNKMEKDNWQSQTKLKQYIYQIRKSQQEKTKEQVEKKQKLEQNNPNHYVYQNEGFSQIQLICSKNQLKETNLFKLKEQAYQEKYKIYINNLKIKKMRQYLKSSKYEAVENISFKKDWYDNEYNTNKAHFHFPFYRTPGPALASTFISLIMQSISNLVIFFQPGDSVFAQVGTFTAVVIGIGGLISSIQSQIILKDKQTLVQLAVYLMFLTPFLTILWRAFASTQNNDPLQHPIFWICMVIMLFSILCPIYIQLHYIYMKNRRFHLNLTILKGYQPVYLILPGSKQLDLLLGINDQENQKKQQKQTLTQVMLTCSLNMINQFLKAYQIIEFEQKDKITKEIAIIKQKSTQIIEALITEESNNISALSQSNKFYNQVKELVFQYEDIRTSTSTPLQE